MKMKKVFKFVIGYILWYLAGYLIFLPFGLTKRWYISLGSYVGCCIAHNYLNREEK